MKRELPKGFEFGQKVNNDFFKYDFNLIPSKYKDLVINISKLLTKANFERIRNEDLDVVIPNITFEQIKFNKMTIFNCLFLNEPYCQL